MKTLLPIISLAVIVSPPVLAEGELRAKAAVAIKRDFQPRGQADLDRLAEDGVQAICNRTGNKPPESIAKRLEEVGTATVMPLGSPIGSNRGILTRASLEIIIEQASVPVVVDAGLGVPSHAAEALELGASAVLVNTAIAVAGNPAGMARAFRKAVEAGREAFLAGRGGTSAHASASLRKFTGTTEQPPMRPPRLANAVSQPFSAKTAIRRFGPRSKYT